MTHLHWMKTIVITVLAAGILASVDTATAASCGPDRPPGNDFLFEHPRKGGRIALGLVQAFSQCLSPSTTSEGGIPSCVPQTRKEAGGNPTSGWRWGDPSSGIVTLKGICPDAADIAVDLRLSGIVDGNGDPVSGTGTLAIAASVTSDDPVGGSMTAVNAELSIPFPISGGAAKFKTTATAMRAMASLPPLPNATSLQLAFLDPFAPHGGLLEVRDANGNAFARPGIATPGKPGGPTCGFTRPTTSKTTITNLVQAYTECDPMYANATTEGGQAACATAETYNEQGGSPTDGWQWNPQSASAKVRIAAKRSAACQALGTTLPPACPGGSNPEGDTADLAITLTIKGIEDVMGPVNGDGSLTLVLRITMDDRVGGSMTLVDGAPSVPITLLGGKATVKTSLNAMFNSFMHPGFPPCTSSEILGILVIDENGSQFATLGTWLP